MTRTKLNNDVARRELDCLTKITAGLLASRGDFHSMSAKDLVAEAEEIVDELRMRAGMRALRVALNAAEDHFNEKESQTIAMKLLKKQMSVAEKHAVFLRRLPIYEALANMPPADHWPNRPERFAWENSQIIKFICAQGVDLDEAKRIFQQAHVHGNSSGAWISFDPETRLWTGKNVSSIRACSADLNPLRGAEENAQRAGDVSSRRQAAELQGEQLATPGLTLPVQKQSAGPVVLVGGKMGAGFKQPKMSTCILIRDLSASTIGRGIPHYGEAERAATQQAIDAYNARSPKKERAEHDDPALLEQGGAGASSVLEGRFYD